MITIENQYASAVIFADTVDPGAMGLIRALCGSPVAEGCKIRIMPDVHAGKGCAVGTTMTLRDRVLPALVGADIGYGMGVWKVRAKRLELQKLDKLVRERVPAGSRIRETPHRFVTETSLDELRCVKHIRREKALCSIGTLGGGNHFIELDRNESGELFLIIHSGSRHLGAEVAAYYQEAAFRETPEGIPYEFACASGELMKDYLHDMQLVQQFAEWNRRAIADEIIKGMKWDVEEHFSTVHNYIDCDSMILRKGAVSARLGEKLIIPLNMRDGCLLCVGKGNPDWNKSAPHGAGRLMSRSEARQSFTLSQFKKEMKGVYTSSVSRETLDEAPMAYKPPEEILSKIGDTVTVAGRLTPLYNFKAGG